MTTIRLASRRDRYGVAAMMQRSWIDAYPPMVPARHMRRDKARGIERWLAERMKWPGYRALTIGAPRSPLGVCAFFPVRPGLFEIDLMFVAPGARSAGVGSALLSQAIATIEERHAACRLWVGTRNTRAKRWYVRHGFVHTGLKAHLRWNGFMWQVDEMHRRVVSPRVSGGDRPVMPEPACPAPGEGRERGSDPRP
ncbi:GNAT family N-acetyltransferase [Azospirillum picis]|uniref:GNAT superfamily N-acetyltransferase n=1 Tax=Azospirillum picis TaxID=488438 RepID=A0ABU0MNW0_9PROT|nr:GNAT family N-acetyltransferase [Azospirillum picis]MBP2301196.1 GNAT superfamily N-acetyltransferase [Azospirillum picis]MDQ0534841.1 GNAT superfamily N-acetyltransferase [Azospirillum picis]